MTTSLYVQGDKMLTFMHVTLAKVAVFVNLGQAVRGCRLAASEATNWLAKLSEAKIAYRADEWGRERRRTAFGAGTSLGRPSFSNRTARRQPAYQTQ